MPTLFEYANMYAKFNNVVVLLSAHQVSERHYKYLADQVITMQSVATQAANNVDANDIKSILARGSLKKIEEQMRAAGLFESYSTI
jgi:stalled ribosome rescue protein Dom34